MGNSKTRFAIHYLPFTMTQFPGFSSSETFTQVPDSLFRLLGEIDDLNELKVTLYVLWRIEHMDGAFRQICRSEIAEDDDFMSGMSADGLDSGLEKAVRRGTLLQVESFYFLNSPRGRASAEAMKKGEWRASAVPSTPPREVPNVFKLYEENIGPLTPLIADALKDAEKSYPSDWIEKAFLIAVVNKVRKWVYVEAILKGWKEEGYHEREDRQDHLQDYDKYKKGRYSDFIKR
jgi:DNA replication protein